MAVKERAKLARSEEDLAEVAASYLVDQGFEVYQEVEFGRGGPRADLVGFCVRTEKLVVVEVKRSICLTLLGQAAAWLPMAHEVWIAIQAPISRHRQADRVFGQEVAKLLGIGMLHLGIGYYTVCLKPEERCFLVSPIAAHLREEQKSYARAGNAKSKFWSPFKQTVETVKKYLAAHGPTLSADLFKSIEHHYASNVSAVQSFKVWVQKGRVDGVEVYKDGMRSGLRLKE